MQGVAGVNLGDIWRPLEVHFRFPLNRWKSLPLDIQRVDNHNNRRGPSWQGPIPQSRNQTMCQGDGMLHAKAQSHASDSYARWEGEGVLREASVCVCSITGHNCIRNNHTTDAQATWTHKPAVITGTKPSVKMVLTVQTAGCHETHTHMHTQVYVETGI